MIVEVTEEDSEWVTGILPNTAGGTYKTEGHWSLR